MIIVDIAEIEGRRYPAGRVTKNLSGGSSPIQTENFSAGYVSLDPRGGQVPWHHHDQEEIYFVVEGEGEMCIGEERRTIRGGQGVFIPPGEYHQLTNTGDVPMIMIYCYGPAGDVEHWKEELEGTLALEGREAPPLPKGACPQVTIPAPEKESGT